MGETTIIEPADRTVVYSPATFEASVVETSPEIEAAKNNIEATRSEMTDTINAIKEQLSPKHLVEEAKDAAIEKAVEAKDAVVDKVSDVAHNVMASVTGAAQSLGDKVSEFTEGAKDKLHELTHGGESKPAVTGATVYGESANIVPKQTGDLFMDVIKENPIPAALVGVGLGWLLVDAIIKSQNGTTATTGGTYSSGTYGTGAGTIYTSVPGRGTYAPTYSSAPSYSTGDGGNIGADAKAAFNDAGNKLQETGQKVGNAIDDAKAKAANTVQDLSEKASNVASDLGSKASNLASDLGGKASNIADDLKHKAGDATELVQTKAGELGDAAQQNARKAASATQDFVTGNPLAAGAIALVVGTIVGLMLPASEPENKLMGSYRDQLADQAGQQAQDLLGKVQSVAGDALGEAKEKLAEVKDSVQSKLAEATDEVETQVAEAADDVKSKVKKGAKDEGLVPV